MAEDLSPEVRRELELDERANEIRRQFLSSPAFLELLRRSQEDEAAGRLISHEELLRQHETAD